MKRPESNYITAGYCQNVGATTAPLGQLGMLVFVVVHMHRFWGGSQSLGNILFFFKFQGAGDIFMCHFILFLDLLPIVEKLLVYCLFEKCVLPFSRYVHVLNEMTELVREMVFFL